MQYELSFPTSPRVEPDGLVVDLFCGGGGASDGIRQAIGRDPDFAVNHNAEAIAMHEANHPGTRHFRGDVWHASPREVTRGKRVSLLWMSPTCTHFSQAKGGPLRDAKERALAWVGLRWAREAAPDVCALENVPAFETWGRLGPDGKLDPRYRGHTFRTFVGKWKALGYRVDMRRLRGCDFGAPTTRERLYMLFRRDGLPIEWPEATHGPGKMPYKTAAECIDWSIPAPSIFAREKPLVEPTLLRIAHGLRKFVLDAADPFIVDLAGRRAAAFLVQTGYGERTDQAPRVFDIREPLRTVVAGGVKHALVAAFITKGFGGHSSPGGSLRDPLSTVTAKDHHGLVEVAFGDEPERVRAFRDRMGVSDGPPIFDIGFRPLRPRELATAQGFGPGYVLDPEVEGKPLSASAQVRMIGNSVVPQVAAAILRANLGRADRQVAA